MANLGAYTEIEVQPREGLTEFMQKLSGSVQSLMGDSFNPYVVSFGHNTLAAQAKPDDTVVMAMFCRPNVTRQKLAQQFRPVFGPENVETAKAGQGVVVQAFGMRASINPVYDARQMMAFYMSREHGDQIAIHTQGGPKASGYYRQIHNI